MSSYESDPTAALYPMKINDEMKEQNIMSSDVTEAKASQHDSDYRVRPAVISMQNTD